MAMEMKVRASVKLWRPSVGRHVGWFARLHKVEMVFSLDNGPEMKCCQEAQPQKITRHWHNHTKSLPKKSIGKSIIRQSI